MFQLLRVNVDIRTNYPFSKAVFGGNEYLSMEWILKNKEWLFSGIGVAVTVFVVTHVWKWLLDKRNLKKDKDKEICLEMIRRIEKELPNLEYIISKKPFNSPEHEKAVKVASFELLLRNANKFLELGKFRFKVKKLRKYLIDKNASKSHELIKILLPKLKRIVKS